MNRNDLFDAGDQIKQAVQDAVDSKNFSNLSDAISDVINNTINNTMDSLQAAVKEGIHSFGNPGNAGRTNGEAARKIREEMEERRKSRMQPENPKKKLFSVPETISCTMQKWFGYLFGGAMLFLAVISSIIGLAAGEWVIVPVAILTFLGGSGLCFGWFGKGRKELVLRLKRYIEVLGDRKHCPIEELASAVGKSEKFVIKDLKKMFSLGFFKQGHLDKTETMLIADDEVYRQYLNVRNLDEQKTQLDSEFEQSIANLPPDCKEIMREGQRYILHIRECNEKIPGQEMSTKLDRLELVVTKIFGEVEKAPEIAGDLRKMMNYYLPTTQKLLDTYCELDTQDLKGTNIDTTKKEIETALDTVCTAFENLLDGFFQNTAWDISSDITVLNTMLAQEGLTSTGGLSR